MTEFVDDFSTIAKRLFKLAFPMASIQLLTISGYFFCMMMLSTLGHEVLAASALVFSTQVTMIVVGSSILFSLSVLIGHAFGAKDYTGIGSFVQQGWTLGAIISVILVWICYSIKKILVATGQTPEIATLAEQYFRIFAFAIPAILVIMTNQQLCYGIHQQRLITITNRISVPILLICSYLFIFGKAGFPKLGIQGAALAVVIQSWFSVCFTLGHFLTQASYKKFNLFQYRVHQNLNYIKRMFEIGWPISVQISAELSCFFVVAIMIGWLGTTALGAYQIVSQYQFLIVVPLFSLAQASGVIIGQACGAEDYSSIKQLGQASILMALVMTLLTAIIFLSIPKLLSQFFLNPLDNNYKAILHLTVMLFAITAFTQIIDGIRNVLTGSLRGLFDTQFPMWCSVFILWVIGLPCAYLIGFKCHLGLAGIALGMGAGFLVGTLIIFYRWRYQYRRYMTPI